MQNTSGEMSEQEKAHKIEMLRQMMLQAEKTMASAKAMLLQLEGKKKTGRKRKLDEDVEGDAIEGTFDGQIMIGVDGKQYPVPANYASKSKLVEGDMLKLTITPDGSFIYKQIGPANRKSMIGIVSQDERGNFVIFSEGKPYKVLLASITYFKAEPGDEVVIMTPKDIDATWAAIENVLAKGGDFKTPTVMPTPAAGKIQPKAPSKKVIEENEFDSWKNDLHESTPAAPQKTAPFVQDDFGHMQIQPKPTKSNNNDFEDEWMSDIAELEKEISKQGF